MFPRRSLFFLVLIACGSLMWVAARAQNPIPGPNVNMVSGTTWPGGDPFLQRQNEPSIAVSTRNPLHLLAGANDYRTVDLSVLTDRVIGDAWLGLFKSFDGGQTWRSTVLPGCPYSVPECTTVPANVLSFQAGSDPTVRAGTNGMFYYSGIAFNRGDNQPGAVFVARLIDDNSRERVVDDPIRYISTVVVDTGNAGQFLDKPWLAVDIPRPGAGTCTIPGAPGVPVQTFPAGNAYLAYSIFVGNENNIRTKVVFARSTDCGATWSHPIKLSEGYPINQGVVTAIDSNTGAIYVAWRQFKVLSGSGAVLNPDSILIAKSVDGGQTFTKAILVAEFTPFEQGTSAFSFRNNAFPTMAVDHTGRVYIAFAGRVGPEGDGRIVLVSSMDGVSWTSPAPMESPIPNQSSNGSVYNPGRGHQFMPALSFAGGKLMLAYYAQRIDHTVGVLQCPVASCSNISQFVEGHRPAGELFPAPPDPSQLTQVFNTFLADAPPPGFTSPMLQRRHTLDVRIAKADPGPSPVFTTAQVSQYPFGSPSAGSNSKPIEQLRFNPPNLPLFAQGTRPFIGDYIDIAAQPFSAVSNPGWAYNTAPSNSTVFHAVWTDNRDVRPPADGNWTNYTPVFAPPVGPAGPACNAGFTGTRNQNIYTSRISQGLIAAALQNSKQLGFIPNTTTLLQRLFVVFVQNTTNQARTFRLTITNQPSGGQASFLQFSELTTLDVSVARRSTVSRPVFVTSTNPDASVTVNIVEVSAPGGSDVPGGLQGTVVLNPDISNPDISNPDISNPDISNAEVYNPDISNPDISNPDISNPDISNPDISNPDISNPDISNPDITNPGVPTPDISNPDISNPDISNPDITNPDISNGALTDGVWKVTNKGNTSASYNIKLLVSGGVPAGFELQLILYKVYRTPAAQNCTLQQVAQNILLSNVINPTVLTNPSSIGTPDISNPDITNPTLALAPGEEGRIALRVNGPTKAAVVSFLQNTVQPVVVSQAANTGTTTPPVALVITTLSLPDGITGASYSQTLAAIGGTGTRTWSLAGALPVGLSLNSATGVISGTPTAAGIFPFTVQVADSATPQNTDTQNLVIRIGDPLVITTASLSDGVLGTSYSQTLAATGGIGPRTWSLTAGSLPTGLTLSGAGVISGTPAALGTFSFTVQVVDSSSPQQVAAKSLSIQIGAPLAITTASPLPDALIGAAYSQSLAATGGIGVRTWSLALGSNPLPAGLSLSSAGVLSGTPTALGTFTFTIQVVDSSNPVQSATKSFTLRKALTGGGGTATIDGVLSPGEWDLAAQYNLTVNVPGGGTTPATLFVMNDNTNLYIALRFARGVVDSENLLNVEVDNDNDGVAENGDDYFTYQFNPINVFSDAHRSSDPPCTPAQVAGCVTTDNTFGGTNDGAGAFANSGGFSVYETSKPLNSGDIGNDFSVATGGSIGFFIGLRVGTAFTNFPGFRNYAGLHIAGYGNVTDAIGDATASGQPPPDPDLVRGTGIVSNGNLKLSVRFAPGTFSSTTTVAQFTLDTDENAATGHPGTTAAGVIDSGVIGAEYVVNLGSNCSTPAQILRYTGPPINTFTVEPTAPAITFVTNGMDVLIPLSALGNDDGKLKFKVTTQRQLSPPTCGFTGILDFMPDAGSAAGTVQ